MDRTRLVKKAVLSVVCGLVLALPMAEPAGARTAGALVGSGIPSGKDLMNRLKQASKRYGSSHVVMKLTEVVPTQLLLTMSLTADAARQPQRIRESVKVHVENETTQSPVRSDADTTVVVVGQRAATRQDHRAWQCGSVTTVLGQYADIMKSLNPQAANPVNLGATNVGGEPVWHVRATIDLTLLATKYRIPADLYIARSNYTLRRETASPVLRVSNVTIREQLVMDASRYGEKVTVQLPSQCR